MIQTFENEYLYVTEQKPFRDNLNKRKNMFKSSTQSETTAPFVWRVKYFTKAFLKSANLEEKKSDSKYEPEGRFCDSVETLK